MARYAPSLKLVEHNTQYKKVKINLLPFSILSLYKSIILCNHSIHLYG